MVFSEACTSYYIPSGRGLTPILLTAVYIASFREMMVALTNYLKICRVMKILWIHSFLMHILRGS